MTLNENLHGQKESFIKEIERKHYGDMLKNIGIEEGQEEYWAIPNFVVPDPPDAAGIPYWLEDFVDDQLAGALSEAWPGHAMKSVIQGLCVDRIGRQLGVLYIIDYDGDICYRGNYNQSSTGTIKIGTTAYAF